MEAPVRSGDTLAGRYHVDRVLGAGGMGVVVAASDTLLGRRVAIKFLLGESALNPEVVARFAREARSAARIESEHVARVLDVGTLAGGEPYMVMEYLDGSDLAHHIVAQGALPIAESVDYVLQACEAIAEAHALGIVHRDLKPANLFLTRRTDGSSFVKVLDFGISKASGGPPGSGPEASLTKTSAVMGSPLYMAPEQMRSTRQVDQRADVWALGVILYELLTGKVPFEATTMPELCAMVLTEAPPPLVERCPHAPPGLAKVIERCLEKDPAARFANVAELCHELAPFGPRRSRLSAERIGRVLGVSPAETASVPPSDGAPLAARQSEAVTARQGESTSAAWSPAAPRGRQGGVSARLGLLAAVLAAGIAVFVVARGGSREPAPSGASAAANLATPPTLPAQMPSSAPAPPVETAVAGALAAIPVPLAAESAAPVASAMPLVRASSPATPAVAAAARHRASAPVPSKPVVTPVLAEPPKPVAEPAPAPPPVPAPAPAPAPKKRNPLDFILK